MRWSLQQLGLIDPAKAEADLGIVWSAQGAAQALVLQAQDRDAASAKGLVERLENATAQANYWESTRSEAADEGWDSAREALLVAFDQLRVDAAVLLEEQHKKTQFRGALMGASIVFVGAAGLFWALRKRKKR